MDCFSVLKKYVPTLRDKRQYHIYILFCVSIVLLLMIFYLLIKYPDPIIPEEITNRFIILDVNAPTPLSMFLCNYAHNPKDCGHLWNNIVTFCGAMIIIFIGSVLLPGNNWKTQKNFLRIVFLIIVLALPFTISGISILCGRRIGMEHTVGFSGIDFALFGVSTFILIKCLFLNLKPNWEKKLMWPIFGATLIGICFLGVIQYITGGPNVNAISHAVGPIYGLITSIAVSSLITNPTHKWKYGVGIFLLAIFFIPSVLWIFL